MTVSSLPDTIVPDPAFRRQVRDLNGEKVTACFQCEKCTNGCPVAFSMDIVPHKVMRSVILGLRDQVLKSETIWVCASCETCTTRCPNGIDIAHVMDTLRQISLREGKTAQDNAPVFHSAFLSSVRGRGRVAETEMVARYTLKSQGLGGLLKQAGMGLAMFKRGKIKILPRFHSVSQVKKIFRGAEQKG
ncbi:MAG: 4Fe-4S dicluster domain-containing protein [Chloroflexi bacterium]|nr:4Fe-4S dicluster domain-containing protein [Chloroflexota bacterium]